MAGNFYGGDVAQLRQLAKDLAGGANRLSLLGSQLSSVISTGAGDAISLNRFVFDYEVTRGDVWTLRLPPAPSR